MSRSTSNREKVSSPPGGRDRPLSSCRADASIEPSGEDSAETLGRSGSCRNIRESGAGSRLLWLPLGSCSFVSSYVLWRPAASASLGTLRHVRLTLSPAIADYLAMSWCPDRRAERIASYAVVLAHDSLSDRFRRAVDRLHPQTTACDNPSGRARQLEDLCIQVIRQGAERTSHNLERVVIERYGAFPTHATDWVLQMTHESIERLRAVIQGHLDARFDTSSVDWDRIAGEHRHAMEGCAQRLAVPGPPGNPDRPTAAGARSRS